MRSQLALTMLAAAAGMMEPPRHAYVRLISVELKTPKHGEPGSRSESVRAHKKEVKRKKRARKNKRGY